MAPAPAFDLFTIGHSNHPIEQFLALMQGAGVTAIADVRSVPSSRRYPWFSRTRLADRLAREGLAYVPLGDALGGRPRDPALLRDGVADYEAMAGTPEFRAGLDRVSEGARSFRICLMCAEREPLDCHRCLLIAPALAARGLAIGHILADAKSPNPPVIQLSCAELAINLSAADDLGIKISRQLLARADHVID